MAKNTKNTKAGKLVAEICMYGTSYKSGWLTRTVDGQNLGDGEVFDGRSLNDALWLACAEIREAGHKSGQVVVFEPTGRLMAYCDVSRPPYWGDLAWQPAPVLTISAEAILAAAKAPA